MSRDSSPLGLSTPVAKFEMDMAYRTRIKMTTIFHRPPT